MRRIAIVSVSRADYSYLRPLILQLRSRSDCEVCVVAAAHHFVGGTSRSIQQFIEDGIPIEATVPMTPDDDSPHGAATALALGVARFAEAFASLRPEIVVLLGDRYETLAAAAAALPMRLALAHVAGGERSEGAIDEQIRHAISKMSHVHFVSTKEYRERLLRMGESPERVFETGAPSLDTLRTLPRLSRAEIERRFGVQLDARPLLVTYHPATRTAEPPIQQVGEVLAALTTLDTPVIFSEPNADPGGRAVKAQIEQFVQSDPRHRVVSNFGPQAFYSLLEHVGAMVGNSSSGIIEAASFSLPVVDIGPRQRGRVRGANVVTCDCDHSEIVDAVRRAVSPEFRSSIEGMMNPYGRGYAAEAIANELATIRLDDELFMKRFWDGDGQR
jgi:UDP-N-acetylglucosamine 2-epimerase (non-hydrolysing)/GDP/UDP-N,N'-diacetylbacillosamine 2-epimerase (hydrolysing)